MNERIQELMEQAGYKPLPGFDFANSLEELFMEKFAELIVKECVNVCNTRIGSSTYDAGRQRCVSDIKEHFGVE